MANNLDAIFEDIIKDARNVANSAVKSAAKQAQKDLCDQAKKGLQEYYDNYTPTMYTRTNKLRRIIQPYWADRSGSNGISIEVGVQYKSSALVGAYRSNSWYHQSGNGWISRISSGFNWDGSNNGMPDPDWIFTNFMEGIHPRTDISVVSGKKIYNYSPVEDSTSQIELIERFLDVEMPAKIDVYIQNALIGNIMGRLG